MLTQVEGAVASGQVVVIRSVRDERVFEEAPRDPSMPSLGSGGAAHASADIKSRAIGRKRNGFGKALGDVLLESGQTVEGVIRENLAAALQQAGYQVRSENFAGASPLVIDVDIKQFWAWFQPGFWQITLNANIATDLHISGGATPTVVSVHAEDKRQAATERAWIHIIDKALQAFRTDVAAKTKEMPCSSNSACRHEEPGEFQNLTSLIFVPASRNPSLAVK